MISKGSSRQLCFVQFFGIPDARAFLERNYPTIYLYTGPDGTADAEGVQVRIAFSRDKIDRPQPGKSDGDWKCTCVSFTMPSQMIFTYLTLPSATI